MTTGPKTHAAFIQGNQGTKEHRVSHNPHPSALFYLFEEVSKLTSPIHNTFLDSNAPSSTSETSRQHRPIVKKEENDAHSFHISNIPCQHGLSVAPPPQLKKVKEESHCSAVTTVVDSHLERNSPWKILSLINLQCEKLLHHSDIERPSVTKSGHSIDTLKPSVLIYEREETPGCVSPVEDAGICSGGAGRNKPECCVKDSKVSGCVQKMDPVRQVLVEETVSSQPHHRDKSGDKCNDGRRIQWNRDCKNHGFSSEQEILNVPNSEKAWSQTHIPASPDTQLTSDTNESAGVNLSKPALILDDNANLVLTTEPPCETPLSSDLPSSQPSLFHITEKGYSSPRQDAEIHSLKPECVHAPLKETSLPLAQLKSSGSNGETNPSPSAAWKPEPWPVQKEESVPLTTQQWRTKTPRKQPHPCRSADIQDPHFQGVTFRMDTELDDSSDQCRLRITSKYSKKLGKRVRKPRLRTRSSQKLIKTSSSDEEGDRTTSVSKGKVCASCCTRKTPMWRDAEDGTPLCNACGIRYKKYRVRCVNCWHIPRKEGNSNSCCLKCGNFVRLTSAQRKHNT